MTDSDKLLNDPDKYATQPGWKNDLIQIGGKPGCGYCHNLLEIGRQDGTGWKCRAFPDGIPWSVVARDGENHTKHIPGDRGFLYSPRIIIPDGKTIGYYFDWDGKARDAETNQELVFDRDVR